MSWITFHKYRFVDKNNLCNLKIKLKYNWCERQEKREWISAWYKTYDVSYNVFYSPRIVEIVLSLYKIRLCVSLPDASVFLYELFIAFASKIISKFDNVSSFSNAPHSNIREDLSGTLNSEFLSSFSTFFSYKFNIKLFKIYIHIMSIYMCGKIV